MPAYEVRKRGFDDDDPYMDPSETVEKPHKFGKRGRRMARLIRHLDMSESRTYPVITMQRHPLPKSFLLPEIVIYAPALENTTATSRYMDKVQALAETIAADERNTEL